MAVHGTYYDGRSSRGDAAELRVAGGQATIHVAGQPVTEAVPAARLIISSRIGSTPRYVRFPDGAQFETTDHAALERELVNHRGRAGILHRLESRWRYLPLALAIVIAFVWWAVVVGVPWASKVVAYSLPDESNEWIAAGALKFLDRHILASSTLPASEQQRLQARFDAFLAPWRVNQTITVLFRSGADSIGANALALPSGHIVFTDEMVRLAHNDEELLAVLAHEVGHLRGRHALRQGIQSSVLTLVAVAVVGDVSALSSLAGSIPLMLTQMGYSRDFEREADSFAVQALRERHIDVAHFTDILARLAQQHCGSGKSESDCAALDPEPEDWRGYWSTHPPTAERIQMLKSLETP